MLGIFFRHFGSLKSSIYINDRKASVFNKCSFHFFVFWGITFTCFVCNNHVCAAFAANKNNDVKGGEEWWVDESLQILVNHVFKADVIDGSLK